MIRFIKTLNTGSIPATGGTAEVEWSPDIDIKITHIAITERTDLSLSDVHVYSTIADVPYTKETVPAVFFGYDIDTAFPLDKPLGKGVRIYFKLTNDSPNAVDCDIILVCE